MPARILVIEDNPANLELMVCLLEAHGYAPLVETDGAEGLAAIERERPDLVLCDIQMPKLNGYELARQVKASPALGKIPLVAVSALAMVGDKERGLAAGFDGYVSKPIETRKFVAQMEAFLGSQRTKLRATPNEPAQEASAPLKKNVKILGVDDLEANLKLLESLFGPLGYKVKTAKGLSDALAAMRQMMPDIVVSDVTMHDGSGYDLCRAVKLEPGLRHIPVVLITSTDSNEAARKKGLAAGAKRYLYRPIDSTTLLAEVEACLAESR